MQRWYQAVRLTMSSEGEFLEIRNGSLQFLQKDKGFSIAIDCTSFDDSTTLQALIFGGEASSSVQIYRISCFFAKPNFYDFVFATED